MSEHPDALPTQRRDPRPALVVAGGALAVMVEQSVIQSALDAAVVANRVDPGSGAEFGPALAAALVAAAPFAIGVFLSLWQLAQILPSLPIPRVLLRGLGATAIGMLVSVLVTVLVSFVTALAGLPSLFAGGRGGFGTGFVSDVLTGVLAAVGTAVEDAPLVLLAAVLVRLRLGKRAEPDAPAPDAPTPEL